MRTHGVGHHSSVDETLAFLAGGGSGGGLGLVPTTVTITSGQTMTLKASDVTIRFDTSGGTTATAVLPAPSYIGERHTFYWWAWGAGQTPPTINADAGHKMVPFAGQAASGAAGLVTTTTISTPGASFTLVWDGTEWTTL